MADLKPCPFCGGEAKLIRGNGYLCYVQCVECGCSTKKLYGDEENTVINLWNTRKPMEAVVAELEKEKSGLTTWAEDEAFKLGIDKAISIVRGKE